jgi:hypothetical protein
MAKDDDDLDVPEPLQAMFDRLWRRLQSPDLAVKLLSQGLENGCYTALLDGEPLPNEYWQQAYLKWHRSRSGFTWEPAFGVNVLKDGMFVEGAFHICKGSGQLQSAAKTPQPTKSEGKQPPRLEAQMVIAILRDAFPDGFSDDDIPGKVTILAERWEAESKAPLGNPGRKGTYALPHPKTIARTIRDYHERPDAYPLRHSG